MTEKFVKLQFSLLTLLVSLITVGSFTYIFLKQPESLRQSRDGVPFFTPPVINPDSGETISVSRLVKHFKEEG